MPWWHCKYLSVLLSLLCLESNFFQTALFLPETLFKHLPNTLEEGETFGTNFNIFSCPSNSRWDKCWERTHLHLNRIMSFILGSPHIYVTREVPCATPFSFTLIHVRAGPRENRELPNASIQELFQELRGARARSGRGGEDLSQTS